ncbi:retrovirus-related Pol polyprotein from transposon TNT 1-94 [Caerostris darwini]|uniref:Retrovirus-related Pol polyprotein from transposon TNT 1-94 n=1 Tax=Caerostris darwini TaxID=1538125 RepID=A0AAV4TEH9_9ARAC|nr:retrovirus-related Pol polyprotein from transposon TNT 1-94 [Caerostris darwini]
MVVHKLTGASVIRLLDESFQIKFDSKKDTIAVFIARIRKLVRRLMDAGHPLEDMYPAFLSIRTLPPDFQANAERVLNRKIISVRCDNAMEFCHNKFSKYLNDQGISCEKTKIYSPEQNGLSERFNLTAMDCVQAMLHDSGVDKCFWAEALQPQGFKDPIKTEYVCYFKKSIYGLHQNGREWYYEFESILLEWCDCVYVYKKCVPLLLYVDDIVIFGKTERDIDIAVSLLQNKFNIKILGKIQKLLDSDFASNRDDRVSIGGMILMIDKAPISWSAFKHKCVILSTMEAECISLSETAKEAIWIQNVINECKILDIKFSSQPVRYCDNQAAINFSHSSVENYRIKL